MKANTNLGNNVLTIYTILTAASAKFLEVTKFIEYLPSTKFHVNLFELHQECVNK